MNETKSMIILQALMNADAGLSSEMIQVMPAIRTVGIRYSLIFENRLALRSPTLSVISSQIPPRPSAWSF